MSSALPARRPGGDTTAETNDLFLLERARAGDREAFTMVADRHRSAATSLARRLASSQDAADRLVTRAVDQLEERNRRAEGQWGAFLPELLAAVRSMRGGNSSGGRGSTTATSTSQWTAASDAYDRLPIEDRAALWHGVVEGEPDELVARAAGVPVAEVPATVAAARSKFRGTYLQDHLDRTAAPECRRSMVAVDSGATRLPATAHRSTCPECRKVDRDLAMFDGQLDWVLATVVLGAHALLHLRAADGARGGVAAVVVAEPEPEPVPPESEVVRAAAVPPPSEGVASPRPSRPSRRGVLWPLAGVAAALVVVGGMTTAVLDPWPSTPTPAPTGAAQDWQVHPAPQLPAPRSGAGPTDHTRLARVGPDADGLVRTRNVSVQPPQPSTPAPEPTTTAATNTAPAPSTADSTPTGGPTTTSTATSTGTSITTGTSTSSGGGAGDQQGGQTGDQAGGDQTGGAPDRGGPPRHAGQQGPPAHSHAGGTSDGGPRGKGGGKSRGGGQKGHG